MSHEGEGGEFDVLTFDCYGTLIDWHGGVRAAAAELPGLEGVDLERLELDREAADMELGRGPYRPYGEILAESLVRAAAQQGREVRDDEAERFARSMSAWRPFEDSRWALERLSRRYRLAILSNVETRVLEASVEQLGVTFELLITAEEVRSYKPAPRHFEVALDRLGCPKDALLHVACSLYHDVRPAQALGIESAFVDRDGRAIPEDLHPRYVAPDLATLADVIGC